MIHELQNLASNKGGSTSKCGARCHFGYKLCCTFSSMPAVSCSFLSQWCGHCKRLAPTWDKLADELAANDVNVKIAKVDCTTERDTCSRQAIRGYPTLQLFKPGQSEPVKYQGAREMPALVSFAKEHHVAA
jgi:protein disulfide-isomerase-like protein